jgi:hypothetical protein
MDSTHLFLARWNTLHIFELDDSIPTSLKYVDKLTLKTVVHKMLVVATDLYLGESNGYL